VRWKLTYHTISGFGHSNIKINITLTLTLMNTISITDVLLGYWLYCCPDMLVPELNECLIKPILARLVFIFRLPWCIHKSRIIVDFLGVKTPPDAGTFPTVIDNKRLATYPVRLFHAKNHLLASCEKRLVLVNLITLLVLTDCPNIKYISVKTALDQTSKQTNICILYDLLYLAPMNNLVI